MTSEETIDDVTKTTETKKVDDEKHEEALNHRNGPKNKETKSNKSHDLMRLVYEVPDEENKNEIVLTNSKMLKENPPVTIVQITEHNGCEIELDKVTNKECDVYFKVIDDSSPEHVGNKVVYDVTSMELTHDEYKEVIEGPSDECSDEEFNEIRRLLESKPKALERYLRECATNEEINRVHNLTSSTPLSPLPNHQTRSTSVTSDMFQRWLASSPVKVSDNVDNKSNMIKRSLFA